MAAAPTRKTSSRAHSTHPIGKYADDNHLMIASERFSRARFIRIVSDKNGRKREKTEGLRPSAVVALERIQEFAQAIHDEWVSEHEGSERGWQTEAARRCGIHITTMWNIIHGKVTKVDSETVDAIVAHTGIPTCLINDPEV